MNDPTPFIARLALARDHIAEARRYVRTQSQAARKILAETMVIFDAMEDDAYYIDGEHLFDTTSMVARSWDNINAVRSAVGVDNDAACGGIDLVRHELAILMSDLRREWEREDRDRGLAEAYGS